MQDTAPADRCRHRRSTACPLRPAAGAARADRDAAKRVAACRRRSGPAGRPADRLPDPAGLEGPLRGDNILPALPKLRRVGNKPVHFIGLAVNGDWEPIVHGGVYTKLQAGVQLATRTTALNELEYSELVTRLRAVADEIGAEPEVPDMIEVMSEAKNLHRFVAGHDAQLGVNLAVERRAVGDRHPDRRAGKARASTCARTAASPCRTATAACCSPLSTNVTLGADTTSRLTLLLDVPLRGRRRATASARWSPAPSRW